MRHHLIFRSVLVTLILPLLFNACIRRATSTDTEIDGDGRTRVDKQEAGTDQKNGTKGEEPDQAPVSIAGHFILTPKNARARCGFNAVGGKEYLVSCHAVAAIGGEEFRATALGNGVTFEWNTPVAISGVPIVPVDTTKDCDASATSLSRSCRVTLQADAPSLVKFEFDIADRETPPRAEFDLVNLPFSVITFGMITQSPLLFDVAGASASPTDVHLGYQSERWRPTERLLEPISAFCTRDRRLYIASGRYVYAMENGELRLFAGSGNPGSSRTDQATRLYFSGTLKLACHPDFVVVSDSQKGLFLLRDGVAPEKLPPMPAPSEGSQGPATAGGAIWARPDGSILVADYGPSRIVEYYVLPNGAYGTRIFASFVAGERAVVTDRLPFAWPKLVGVAPNGAVYVVLAGTPSGNTEAVVKISKVGPGAHTVTAFVPPNAPNSLGLVGFGNEILASKLPLSDSSALAFDGDDLLVSSKYLLTSGVFRFHDTKVKYVVGIPPRDNTTPKVQAVDPIPADKVYFTKPAAVTMHDGAMLVGDDLGHVTRVAPLPAGSKAIPQTTTFAGMPYPHNFVGYTVPYPGVGKAVPVENAIFGEPFGVAVGPDGSYYVADTVFQRVRRLFTPSGAEGSPTHVMDLAGGPPRYSGTKLTCDSHYTSVDAALNICNAKTVALAGNAVYFGDGMSPPHVRRILNGRVDLIAGAQAQNSVRPFTDGMEARYMDLGSIHSLVIDSRQQNMFVADSAHGIVFRLAPNAAGSMRAYTVVTTGSVGVQKGAPVGTVYGANQLLLWQTKGVALDREDTLYVADTGNRRILKFDADRLAARVIMEAQAIGAPGFSPESLAVDSRGSVYVVDGDPAGPRVWLLAPSAAGYVPRVLFGNRTEHDCGRGTQRIVARADRLEAELSASLSVVCPGRPNAVTVRDRCAERNEFQIVISQSFGTAGGSMGSLRSGNLVEIRRPCTPLSARLPAAPTIESLLADIPLASPFR